jgi:hypothetical protein
VRPPLTKFSELGEEGKRRLNEILGYVNELNSLIPRRATTIAA